MDRFGPFQLAIIDQQGVSGCCKGLGRGTDPKKCLCVRWHLFIHILEPKSVSEEHLTIVVDGYSDTRHFKKVSNRIDVVMPPGSIYLARVGSFERQ